MRLKKLFRTFRSAFFRFPVIRLLRFIRLRSLNPVSRKFGMNRGKPVDRYYIEAFLEKYSKDIRGCALEIGGSVYSSMFGANRITHQDILHAVPGNPNANIVGDLSTGKGIPIEKYDCLIVTQTLHVIYDVRTAVANIHRALVPGGVALVTLPGISQLSRYDMERWGDFWRFTNLSAGRIFAELFGETNVDVIYYGNVLSAVGFLHGLPAEEFSEKELNFNDPDYQVLVCVRAEKRIDNFEHSGAKKNT